MKELEYISPTRLRLWEQDKERFYLEYLSDNRPEREPQTQPMSVGSSFDAFAKNHLHEGLFGKGFDPRFDLMTIFESQVESHHRDFAFEAGKHCFDQYKKSGALADLLLELQKAVGTPRFEIEVKGVIDGRREGVTLDIQGITFLGKPDVFFINSLGAHVIIDWKVNGYCANRTISPMQGYVRLRACDPLFPGYYVNKGHHKDAVLLSKNGVTINAAGCLEDFNEDWARQLSVYAWLCGMDVGSEYIVGIDQLVCKPSGGRPEIRVAEHRAHVRKDHQWSIFREAQDMWSTCRSDHIFRDLSPEDSKARCSQLDELKAVLDGDGSIQDDWFKTVCR